MLNKVHVIGRLGQDPVARYLPDNTATVTLSIATTERWRDRDGNPQEKTEWIRCVAWSKLAEICAEYLRKGSLIYVEGKIETQKWEKDGETRYTTQVRLDRMQMLDKRSDSAGAPSGQASAEKTTSGRPRQADDLEDDIPF